MKTLVIGGCGFIGSHVVDSLLSRGIDVRVFDRRAEPFRPSLSDVEYVMGDFTNTQHICAALGGVDSVIHLASTTVPSTANLDPVADITGNLVSTVNLLDAMRAAGTRRLIFLSSGGTVYGIPESDPVPEGHPLRPINSYGIVKVAIENYIFMEQKLHGLQPVILRASNPYGPRQGHTGIQGIIGTFLSRIARGEMIEVWGDGSVVRDFIHVRDLAELCARAIESDAIGSFNAGSGTGTSVKQIISCITRTVQATGNSAINPLFRPGRNFDVPRVVLDITKARRAFNWTPKIPLDIGISECWSWVRAQSGYTTDRPTIHESASSVMADSELRQAS